MSSRVLHLVPWFGRGGRERLVADLIAAMRPEWDGTVLYGAGDGVDDLTPRGGALSAGIDARVVPLFPSTPPNLVRAAFAIRQEARRSGAAVIHSHHRFAGLAGRVAAAAAGVPFVSTVHDLADGHAASSRFACGRTITVFSDAVARHLQSAFGVDPSRIQQIPMGVANRNVSGAEAGAEISAAAPGRTMVGFLGRLVWEKGPDVFVRAAALVARDRPDVEFVVAGAGDMQAALERHAVTRGLAGRVRWLGWQPDPARLLALMDIVVVPSRREGFGLSALEAMRAGKPVIASATGGLPELITPDVNGRLVPTDDPEALATAIRALVDDAPARRRLGEAARLRGAGFDIAATAAAVARVYRSVMTRAGETKA
jgi:glycosyltransferase involved in cell wall biosynthesis